MTSFRDLLRIVEAAGGDTSLYHTTSAYAADLILTSGEIRPKNHDSYVSLSEIPLPGGDISGTSVTIVFHGAALAGQVEPVDYTEGWFEEHAAQAAYIAGEGWREQYTPPEELYDAPDGEDDDFWEPDEDALEDHERAAECEAFLWKSGEQEHISLLPGQPVRFDKGAVAGLILHHGQEIREWAEHLAAMGYARVEVTRQ